jgi:hypothetical protein
MELSTKEQQRQRVLTASDRYRRAANNVQEAKRELYAVQEKLRLAQEEFLAASSELDSLIVPPTGEPTANEEAAGNDGANQPGGRTEEGKFGPAHPEGTVKDRIVAFVQTHEGNHSHQELAKALGTTDGTARWACWELVKEGKLAKPGENQYAAVTEH